MGSHRTKRGHSDSGCVTVQKHVCTHELYLDVLVLQEWTWTPEDYLCPEHKSACLLVTCARLSASYFWAIYWCRCCWPDLNLRGTKFGLPFFHPKIKRFFFFYLFLKLKWLLIRVMILSSNWWFFKCSPGLMCLVCSPPPPLPQVLLSTSPATSSSTASAPSLKPPWWVSNTIFPSIRTAAWSDASAVSLFLP